MKLLRYLRYLLIKFGAKRYCTDCLIISPYPNEYVCCQGSFLEYKSLRNYLICEDCYKMRRFTLDYNGTCWTLNKGWWA